MHQRILMPSTSKHPYNNMQMILYKHNLWYNQHVCYSIYVCDHLFYIYIYKEHAHSKIRSLQWLWGKYGVVTMVLTPVIHYSKIEGTKRCSKRGTTALEHLLWHLQSIIRHNKRWSPQASLLILNPITKHYPHNEIISISSVTL